MYCARSIEIGSIAPAGTNSTTSIASVDSSPRDFSSSGKSTAYLSGSYS